MQKQRDIGADLLCQQEPFRLREPAIEFPLQAQQRGDGVGRAPAQAALHRQLLVDVNMNLGPQAK